MSTLPLDIVGKGYEVSVLDEAPNVPDGQASGCQLLLISCSSTAPMAAPDASTVIAVTAYGTTSLLLPTPLRAILYKGPNQPNGKVLISTAAANWADGAAPLANQAGHSFAGSLTGVVADSPNIKFLAYNNVPPAVPNVQTKSNSKGVIIVSTAARANEGRWIVHTVPGFPAAKTGYNWPAAETAKGHLLICMTIAETQINAIASSLIRAEPFVYYNDIPESETAGIGDFKKLAEGQTATLPPFTIKQSIKIAPAAPIDVHIYSKSAKSRYERNIRLIKSPAQIGDHATNIEADQSNWIVSEPGNIFCFMDKPYTKSQATEPALAICIDKDTIFAQFNAIAAQVENCPQ
ncbi:Deoxyribonuclease-2-alpha [Trichinella nativa]|uniref:Deoxyribonuclease-2-alpha n=1 Tax=Trichinella nativa TaxID=6335 RepID=A0A0V1KRU5_9BILA|nr:Deoxyribonuclease-2-alpha [Trichinella nativa]